VRRGGGYTPRWIDATPILWIVLPGVCTGTTLKSKPPTNAVASITDDYLVRSAQRVVTIESKVEALWCRPDAAAEELRCSA
jgi:hypothetical protein